MQNFIVTDYNFKHERSQFVKNANNCSLVPPAISVALLFVLFWQHKNETLIF